MSATGTGVYAVEMIEMPPKQPRESYLPPARKDRVAVIAYLDKPTRDDLKRMAIDLGTTVQEWIETSIKDAIAKHQQQK